ncbi:MAG: beta-propeller fold lactonase family protein [Bryobacterales bacterium]|nr:beta-propeller fold lactonase family protein [Bryobacterales bacterium]
MRLLVFMILAAAALSGQTPRLLVLEKGASALGYYTLEGQRVGEVKVGVHPHEMAASPDGRFVYITDNGAMRIEDAGKGGNTVSIVDVPGRRRIGVIKLDQFFRPHGIDLDPTTNRLAITVENPDQFLLLDIRDRRILRAYDTKGKTPHMVRFGPTKGGAQYAYVSNSGSGTVSAIQLATGGEMKVMPTGARPEGSVLSVNQSELYVTNRESGTITVIDTARHAQIGEIRTGGKGPVRCDVTPDGRYLVYALMHDHKIEIADLETRRPVAQIAVEGEPISLSVSADGQYAFASSEEIDMVHVISLKTRKLVRSFKTPKGAGPDPVLMVKAK